MEYAEINMPVFKPVRIPTRQLNWFQRALKSFKRRNWELVEDYVLYIPWLNETFLIPKGFIFDGASVPRAFWLLVDPTGILLIGSMFHDFGYRYTCFLNDKFEIVHADVKREFVDDLIKDISEYENGWHLMNDAAWAALRVFGWVGWYKDRRDNRNVLLEYGDRIKG